MGLQALIFDVDGTLAETAEIHRAAFNQAFEEFDVNWRWGIPTFSYLRKLADDNEMLCTFNSMTTQNSKFQKLDGHCLQRISLRKIQVYLAMLSGGAAYLRNGVGDVMEEARRSNVVLAAVSSRPRIEYEMLVTSTLGFNGLSIFDSVRSSQEHPTQNISNYHEILVDLGVSACKSVAIDATEAGVRRAVSLGITTVATPGIYTSSGRFDAAELVLSDLGSPARPYDVILGDADESGYVTLAYLRSLIDRQKAAA